VAAQVARHPEDYRAGLANWDRAIEQLADRPDLQDKAKRARAALHVRYRKAAQAELKRANDAAQELAARDDFDGALATYDGLPDQFAELLPDELENKRSDLRARAERQVRPLLAEARKLAEAGRTSDARARLKAAQAIRYTPLDDELANLRKQLASAEAKPGTDDSAEQTAREQEEARKLEAARREVDRLLLGIEDAVFDGDEAVALALVRGAELTDEIEPDANRFRAVVAVGKAVGAAAHAGLDAVALFREHRGKTVTLSSEKTGTVKGVVRSVNDRAVRLVKEYSVMGEKRQKTYVLPLADLSPESIADLAPAWKPTTPHDHIAVALRAIRACDPKKLEAALEQAPGHPLCDRYAARLPAVKTAARELAARTAWQKDVLPSFRRQTIPDDKIDALSDVLDSFEQKYGRTDFAASVEHDRAVLRSTLETAAATAPVEARADAAKAAWDKIRNYARRGRITSARAVALDKALDRFDDRHGDTRFAVSVGGDVAKLRALVARKLPTIDFKPAVPLQVVSVDRSGPLWPELEVIGTAPTRGGDALAVRRDLKWVVSATRGLSDDDVPAVVRDVRRFRVPGLLLVACGSSPGPLGNLTDAGLARLAPLRRLRMLWVRANITDRGLAHIARLSSLEELRLIYCQGVTAAGIKHLRALDELKCVRIAGCRIGSEGLDHLCKMTQLEALCLRQCSLPCRELNKLSALTGLRKLGLQKLNWWNADVSELTALTKLESLDLSSGRALKPESLKPFTRLPALTYIDLEGSAADDEFLEFLKTFPALRRVNLEKTQVSTRAAAEFARFLKERAKRPDAGAEEE
ncbi:MAG: hypothetical protein R6V58_05635, partial [Planctomycetota bacterium]